jgi:glycosyltransferase involved in cell wall biosynthesis
MPAVELAARAAGKVPSGLWPSVRNYDFLFVLHDWAVSVCPWPSTISVVYAYEDGALRSFRRATDSGCVRIWDLPTPHHRFVESVWIEEGRRWPILATDHRREPLWKQERKENELASANAVCVASSFTKSTLPDSDFDRPVLVIPYGFPTLAFPAKSEAPDGEFVALSVGTQSVRKGTHYLLHAWKRAGLKNAKLRLLGPLRMDRQFMREFEGLFEHLPYVPKARLGEEYRAADLLVFPTLADGFGLVIQEAMSSGTPVLTTPCGGGPECISSGEEGWIVPPRDIDALVDALRTAAANRDGLFRMGQAARRRAEGWTWDDAGRKLVAELAAHSLL